MRVGLTAQSFQLATACPLIAIQRTVKALANAGMYVAYKFSIRRASSKSYGEIPSTECVLTAILTLR